MALAKMFVPYLFIMVMLKLIAREFGMQLMVGFIEASCARFVSGLEERWVRPPAAQINAVVR